MFSRTKVATASEEVFLAETTYSNKTEHEGIQGDPTDGSDYTTGTQRSTYISMVQSYLQKIAETKGETSPRLSVTSRYSNVESIWSVTPDPDVINLQSEEVRPELSRVRIHNKFVQRVFTILTLQFLFKLVFVSAVIFVKPIHQFFHVYGQIVAITFGFNYLFLALILIFLVNFRRYLPMNFIILLLITLSSSVCLGSWFAYIHISIVAFYITTIAVITMFAISLVSCQSKWDVTENITCFWTTVFITLVTISFVMVMVYLGQKSEIRIVIIGAVQIIFFTMWMIYIVRRLATSRGDDITFEEYIFGALTLYVELLLIFLFIVEVIKYCRKLYVLCLIDRRH